MEQQRRHRQAQAIRRRRQQRRLLQSFCLIWFLAFLIGLLCGKLVFARDIGLLARAGAIYGQAAGQAENDRETENGGSEEATADEDESWKLTLVNAKHPMAEGYTPELSEVENHYYFDSRAAGKLQEMLAAGRKEGLDFWICSAYRTIEKQTELYNNKVSRLEAEGLSHQEALTEAKTVVAYPGTSEHNLGLAVDIVAKSYQLLDDKQAETAEAKWLKANCWRYGFILRYPTDKTEETGIIFEPWHYRYVGEEAAKEIMEQGNCLEEYLNEV